MRDEIPFIFIEYFARFLQLTILNTQLFVSYKDVIS